MKCPIDSTELLMSERHGVEIDYCPQCRGVWLDRGELDKIIEQADPPSDERARSDEHEEERSGRPGQQRRRMSSFFEGFGD